MTSIDILKQIDTVSDDAMLTEAQISMLSNYARGTLRNSRARGASPFPFVKLPNGGIRYPVRGYRAALKKLSAPADTAE